jgi:hypothetical protein
MKNVSATVQIDAPPAKVWVALTDLAAYPRWNPLFPEASGQITVGSRLTLKTIQPNGRTMTIKPKILAVEPNAELRWSAGLPGVIGGEHSFTFTLTPADGGTRLVQSEAFRGLLVPFSIKTLAAAQSSYQALNNALKAYVEAQR